MSSREGIPQFKTLEEEKEYWESKGSFGIEAQREEIREGIRDRIRDWSLEKRKGHRLDELDLEILEYLHSQGVVIKVNDHYEELVDA